MKKFSCLGIVSALCVFASATKLSAQNKPAGQGTTAAPNQPGTDPSEYRSIKELIDLLPKQTVMQLKVQNKMSAALEAANQLFIQKAQHKAGILNVKADGWQPLHLEGNPDAFEINVPFQTINVNGTSMGLVTWVTLSDDQRPALEKLQKGKEVSISGELGRVYLKNSPPNGLVLRVELGHSKVVRK